MRPVPDLHPMSTDQQRAEIARSSSATSPAGGSTRCPDRFGVRRRPLRCERGRVLPGGIAVCCRMRPELGVRARAPRDVTGAAGPCAPGLLRPTTSEAVRHPVGPVHPDRAASRGQPRRHRRPTAPRSAPGTSCGSPPGGRRDDAPCHPGGLPARRGQVLKPRKQLLGRLPPEAR